MQKQTCCYQAGNKGIWCGAWSQYHRVNAPLTNSYAVGCSVGQQNVDCDVQHVPCALHAKHWCSISIELMRYQSVKLSKRKLN